VIVVPDGGDLVVFTQEAHAHLAGELAARLPARWEASALVAAARVHDNGWREADRHPTIDEDGRPHTFYRVPPDVYVTIWRRGIDRAAAVDPLVGLLVGLHGARFFGSNPHAQVRTLHDEERARQDRVLAELGLGSSWRDLPAPLQSASDWIAFVDQLSLMICGAFDSASVQIDGVGYRAVLDAGAIILDPWPFTDAGGPISITAHRLRQASYRSADALCDALARSPATTHTRTLSPVSDR
jgi:uncharacterized protein DUF3891